MPLRDQQGEKTPLLDKARRQRSRRRYLASLPTDKSPGHQGGQPGQGVADVGVPGVTDPLSQDCHQCTPAAGVPASLTKGYDAQGRPYKNKGLSVSEVRSEKPQANGQGVTERGYENLPA